ncbi:GNAT family N-acetyltransferase [Archaeoglobus neptunius]|uniref:GNAT family N-acetyltransferase n=1 Tax=Archaeoglobus neptunius TaxID=2798580 RepID=UPI0019257062|nr:GNAT family N-acetyltransferase [Archaeoglobus neptunius]
MEILMTDSRKDWNDVVNVSSQATAFHEYEWLKIMEKHTGFRLYPLIAFKNGEPVGLFPLFFYRKLFLRSVFSPPPGTATSYLGPVFVEDAGLRLSRRESLGTEFQQSVDNFIEETLKANYIYFSAPPGVNDPRAFQWLDYEVRPAYGYMIDLKNGLDSVLERVMTKKIRKECKRAERKGIVVREGGRKELIAIYDLMKDRYKRQNKPVTVSEKYLLELFDKFNLRVFVAEYEDEVVTGTVCIGYRDRFLSWIGFPKPRMKLSPSPNDLLVLEEIRYACEEGYSYYEIMGAAGDRRLHNYYSKFNFDLIVRFSAKKSSAIASLIERAYMKMKDRFGVSRRRGP